MLEEALGEVVVAIRKHWRVADLRKQKLHVDATIQSADDGLADCVGRQQIRGDETDGVFGCVQSCDDGVAGLGLLFLATVVDALEVNNFCECGVRSEE